MTSFLRRVASCRRLPATPEADVDPGQTATLLSIHVAQPGRSLSGSISAPELSSRKQKQQEGAFDSPSSTAPSSGASTPRRMRTAGAGLRARDFQHMALSFVAGGLLTYMCVGLMGQAGTRLGFISDRVLPAELATAPLCSDDRTVLPPSLGLSPMALGTQTHDAHAAPERLIVAVRHAEVCMHIRLSCMHTHSTPSAWLGVVSRRPRLPCSTWACVGSSLLLHEGRAFAAHGRLDRFVRRTK